MSYDSKVPTDSQSAAPDESGENKAPETQEEAPDEMTMGLDSFPKPPKVGDRVPMEVTAVDTENGTATVRCCAGSKMNSGAISKNAAAFDDNQEGEM